MYSEVQRDRTLERPYEGPAGSSPLKLGRATRSRTSPGTTWGERAIIVEPHPAVQAVLEHLLLREGYEVEAFGEASEAAPGRTPEQGPRRLTTGSSPPVLLLVGAGSGDGLYVFRTRNVAGVLDTLAGDAEPSEEAVPRVSNLSVFGIHAFVPKPFGISDILRVVRAVGDFDERKKGSPREPSREET